MSEATLAGKKILMIEDDPFLYSLLTGKTEELRAEGIEVQISMTAEDGLAKARTLKPDLITLDLVLSGMSGFEFLEQIRKEAGIEQTPVVILSNLSTAADKERAKNLGVVGYMVKANNSLDDIVNSIKNVLRGNPIPQPTATDLPTESTFSGPIIVTLD